MTVIPKTSSTIDLGMLSCAAALFPADVLAVPFTRDSAAQPCPFPEGDSVAAEDEAS